MVGTLIMLYFYNNHTMGPFTVLEGYSIDTICHHYVGVMGFLVQQHHSREKQTEMMELVSRSIDTAPTAALPARILPERIWQRAVLHRLFGLVDPVEWRRVG